jgi:thiamine-monophosphate kinase
MGEFEVIERFFKRAARQADVGIGDDCAIWTPSPGHQLAISADMLVEGRHFLSTVNPRDLGHKALAVNLSDLAACGATPRAFLLSLSLPRVDEDWLSCFSEGLFALADVQGCELIGGDTTQGPLNVSITVMGEVPVHQSILRPSRAQRWVSHCAAWPVPWPTSATDFWVTWGTFLKPVVWGLTSTSQRFSV